MKTPIPYYGGKQKLAKRIVAMLPEHNLYCEPFFGGGAVFWTKEPSKVEVVNDTNKELINFYEVLKNEYTALAAEVNISLHSRTQHKDAETIYNAPHLFSRVKRAWAVWMLCVQGFSSKIDGSWGYERKSNSTSKKVKNRVVTFTEDYPIRLQNVQIECADALRIIRSRDCDEAFFYCDPPYYNSNMGHYDGYTIEDFQMLLDTLAGIEGKFLLSSYPSDILQEYKDRYGWHQVTYQQQVTVGGNTKSSKQPRKSKVEVLTANYPINN